MLEQVVLLGVNLIAGYCEIHSKQEEVKISGFVKFSKLINEGGLE